jgi:hypothetical protein
LTSKKQTKLKIGHVHKIKAKETQIAQSLQKLKENKMEDFEG